MNEETNLIVLHENLIGPPLSEVQPDLGQQIPQSAKTKLMTTLELTSETCRWPFGDPASPNFHYCGELPQRGGVYCDTHDSMSRPVSQRKRSF